MRSFILDHFSKRNRKVYPVGLFFIFIGLVCLAVYAYAGDKKDNLNIGEGMEIREVGGFNLLIPKDAKTWYDGDVLKVEDVSEYSASRFITIGMYLEEVRETLSDLQNQIDELRETLDVIVIAEEGK